MIERLSYWFRRLSGTWPCDTCLHPGYAHEDGDCFRVLPLCAWCNDYADRIRAARPGATAWIDIAAKANHAYAPEPYR